VLATGFALFAFLPTFWRLEPRDAVEHMGPLLLVGAGTALVLIAAACWRGMRTGRDAARLVDGWMREGEPLATDIDAPFGAWVTAGAGPAIALVGIRRPRLFLARRVLDALTPDELRAAVGHEAGHQRAGDNLARLLMAWAPDVLRVTGMTAWLEREWARAAELRADHAATRHDVATRLDLATALVKVARMTPGTAPMGAVASTLHDGGDIEMRVRRLTDAADHDRTAAIAPRGCLFAAIVAIALVVALTPLIAHAVQAATELLVHR
jgi:hypothetical protein